MMTAQQIRITHDQAKRLAELIHWLRGDWDVKGILAALYDAAGKGGNFDLAQAAIRAASDPGNRTPAVIALEGPHWRLDQVMPNQKSTGPPPVRVCHTCWEAHAEGISCDPAPNIDHDNPNRIALREQARAAVRRDDR